MIVADKSDLEKAELALARLLDRAGCTEAALIETHWRVFASCPNIHEMKREEFARYYSLCEQAEAEAFAEIADDYSAAKTVADGAWLHSQLGASIDSDEEREIVRRGRQIWYAAIVAKDTILSEAVVRRWAMSR